MTMRLSAGSANTMYSMIRLMDFLAQRLGDNVQWISRAKHRVMTDTPQKTTCIKGCDFFKVVRQTHAQGIFYPSYILGSGGVGFIEAQISFFQVVNAYSPYLS